MKLYNKILTLQIEFGKLRKEGVNSHGKYKYFKLKDIWTKLKSLCEELNIVFLHRDNPNQEIIIKSVENIKEFKDREGNITKNITRESEIVYWKEFTLINLDIDLLPDSRQEILSFPILACAKNTDIAKAKGSAETYAFRYFLMSLLLLEEDEIDPDHDNFELPTTSTYTKQPLMNNATKPNYYGIRKTIPAYVASKNNTSAPTIVTNDYNSNEEAYDWMPTDNQISSFDYTLTTYADFAQDFIFPKMREYDPKSNTEFLIMMGKDWFQEMMDRRFCWLKKINWNKTGMEQRRKEYLNSVKGK